MKNNMVIKTTKNRAIMKNIMSKEMINNYLLEKKGDAHHCNDDECDEFIATTSHVNFTARTTIAKHKFFLKHQLHSYKEDQDRNDHE